MDIRSRFAKRLGICHGMMDPGMGMLAIGEENTLVNAVLISTDRLANA